MRKQLFTLALLLAFTLQENAFAQSEESAPQAEVLQAIVDADGVQRVTIVGGSYFFRPNHIIVKANVPVELTISMEKGWIPHNFILESEEAKISIKANLSTTPQKFVFTPTASGKYPFYCSKQLLFFESHREHGMEGMLEVVN